METRQCAVCKRIKSISEFNFRRKSTGERHRHCRSCQKRYKARFYVRTRKEYIARSARKKAETIRRYRVLIRAYLSAHPCVDCGESDFRVLEFDHVGRKDRSIANMVQSAVAWKKIQEEICQCEVRCGNCHKKKTARERGWYKYLGL